MSAGSTAKAVVLAQTTGADLRAFGGVNLVQRLSRRVSATAPTVGRIQDKTTGTTSRTRSAVRSRRRACRWPARARPTRQWFLLRQQCLRGYFRLGFAAKTARNQTCDGGDPATISAPDTDVTALAVLSLRAVPAKTAAVRTAITDAVGWLTRRQKVNGSFGGGTATEASNSNSTGLAGWALGETGACGAAAARLMVRDLQVAGDVSGTPLAGENGAIAYDRSRLAAARAEGIGVERDQWRRATRAAPALGNLTLAACRAG